MCGILGFFFNNIIIYINIYIKWDSRGSLKGEERKKEKRKKRKESCRGVIGREWEKWVVDFGTLVDLPNDVCFT